MTLNEIVDYQEEQIYLHYVESFPQLPNLPLQMGIYDYRILVEKVRPRVIADHAAY